MAKRGDRKSKRTHTVVFAEAEEFVIMTDVGKTKKSKPNTPELPDSSEEPYASMNEPLD